MRRLALLCVALFAASCRDGAGVALPPFGERPLGWIDVRLQAGGVAAVGSSGPFEVQGTGGEVLHRVQQLGWRSELSLSDGLVTIAGEVLGAPPLEFRPLAGTSLAVDSVRYRGLLRVEARHDGSLQLLNRLPVEDYLRGVLPGEMPERFGLEALKAQAVAARSYALSEAQHGWLYPDARSQVYSGRDSETWLASRAVEATAGQVLAHAGSIVPAWFGSTCGGATALASQVFDDPPEGVMDSVVTCSDCRDSPTWAWTRRVEPDVLCAAFGLPSAALDSISTEPALFPGRPDWITLVAGGRQARLRVVDMRERVSAGRGWTERLPSTRWSAPPRLEAGGLVVEGHGWGHGVGLCQYGARGYARRGASYRAILQRYYPGAELVRLQ